MLINTLEWPTEIRIATAWAIWPTTATMPTIRAMDICGVRLDSALDGIRLATVRGVITPARDGYTCRRTRGAGLRIATVNGLTCLATAGAGVRMVASAIAAGIRCRWCVEVIRAIQVDAVMDRFRFRGYDVLRSTAAERFQWAAVDSRDDLNLAMAR